MKFRSKFEQSKKAINKSEDGTIETTECEKQKNNDFRKVTLPNRPMAYYPVDKYQAGKNMQSRISRKPDGYIEKTLQKITASNLE